jgi:S-layer homology domain
MRAKGEFNPPNPQSQRFTDVPPSNDFYNFIDRLATLQITLGCTTDHSTFCPSDPVNRQEMAAFILRGLGEFDPPAPAGQRFGDVPSANVFYNFVDRLAVLNITLGCTPDHSMYCPNDPVTRGQMAAFLVRAFNL